MTTLALTKRTQDSLATAQSLENFYPDVDGITSLIDFDKFRLENLAAGLFRERVYFVMVSLLKNNTWKEISTIRTNCSECGTVSMTRQLNDIRYFYTDEGVYQCPVCGSTDITYQLVPAFDTTDSFYAWIGEELGVTKRTIMMRKEYIDRCEKMDIPQKEAFAALVKWGVAWMQLARKIEYSVIRGSMSIKEAQNIMRNYNAIPDKSSVMRFIATLEEKDEIELLGVPFTQDFILQVVNPKGGIKYSMYYMAIPLKRDKVADNTIEWWDTDLGLTIARRLKIMTPVTYQEALKYVPNFNFYSVSANRAIILQPVKNLARYLILKANSMKDVLREKGDNHVKSVVSSAIRVGPIKSLFSTLGLLKEYSPSEKDFANILIHEVEDKLGELKIEEVFDD